MVITVRHRKTNIVQMAEGEPILEHCRAGDIALVAEALGWSLYFVGPDGVIDSYDQPYPSEKEALWAAKAAAEFGTA